jgi:hypothetical protein
LSNRILNFSIIFLNIKMVLFPIYLRKQLLFFAMIFDDNPQYPVLRYANGV